jgi:hypothetical protein
MPWNLRLRVFSVEPLAWRDDRSLPGHAAKDFENRKSLRPESWGFGIERSIELSSDKAGWRIHLGVVIRGPIHHVQRD